jgi:hypothetical protein
MKTDPCGVPQFGCRTESFQDLLSQIWFQCITRHRTKLHPVYADNVQIVGRCHPADMDNVPWLTGCGPTVTG